MDALEELYQEVEQRASSPEYVIELINSIFEEIERRAKNDPFLMYAVMLKKYILMKRKIDYINKKVSEYGAAGTDDVINLMRLKDYKNSLKEGMDEYMNHTKIASLEPNERADKFRQIRQDVGNPAFNLLSIRCPYPFS